MNVVYKETQDQFQLDVEDGSYADKMMDGVKRLGLHPSLAEQKSWKANAFEISSLLRRSAVNGTLVTFEYCLPQSSKRIDCMIYGTNAEGFGQVVHIEMKQWQNNTVQELDDDGNFEEVVAFTGGMYQIVSHPSQQVRGYNGYLCNFVDVFSTKEVGLNGVAYCYNYYRMDHGDAALFDPKYEALNKEFRTYAGDKSERSELAAELHKLLCNGDGLSIFNKVAASRIRPSKKLLEEAAGILDEGNIDAFSLLEEQITAKNTIISKIRKLSKLATKSVILVKGGPGTGKTVIALHLVALLAQFKKALNFRYVTKSKPLLEGVKNRLRRGSPVKDLFAKPTAFLPADCKENEYDVLLIDEAHRIANSANNQYTPANKRTDLTMLETFVRAGKICVFFIDDKQAVRSSEIGSEALIRDNAKKFGATVDEVSLVSQFRCNGSNNYLDWVEQILYNRPVTSVFDPKEFDFRIFDDPNELYEEIVAKNKLPDTSARLTAGYCWPWTDHVVDGELAKDVRIGDFAMPWETHGNIARPPKGYVRWYEWAYRPEGIKQVGCIYTAQGFEFDYIGVILGPDIKYNAAAGRIEVDRTPIHDATLRRGGTDTYVRNIYRVLMSRGMKGCFVYCCDPELKQHLLRCVKGAPRAQKEIDYSLVMKVPEMRNAAEPE